MSDGTDADEPDEILGVEIDSARGAKGARGERDARRERARGRRDGSRRDRLVDTIGEAFFAHRTHLSSRSRAIVNSSLDAGDDASGEGLDPMLDTCATSRASTTTTATTIAAEKDAISETNAFDAFFSKVHMITSRPRTSTRRRTSAPRVFASSTTPTNLVGSPRRQDAACAGTV